MPKEHHVSLKIPRIHLACGLAHKVADLVYISKSELNLLSSIST